MAGCTWAASDLEYYWADLGWLAWDGAGHTGEGTWPAWCHPLAPPAAGGGHRGISYCVNINQCHDNVIIILLNSMTCMYTLVMNSDSTVVTTLKMKLQPDNIILSWCAPFKTSRDLILCPTSVILAQVFRVF